jgi:hypothetical protein
MKNTAKNHKIKVTNEIWGSLGNFPQKRKVPFFVESSLFCGKLPSDPQISLVIVNMFHQVPSPKTLSVITK